MGIYLSKPNTTKESQQGENSVLRYGFSCMQGWRMNMEDAHISNPQLTPETSLFAVFDGHGGAEIARFCEKYFPIELLKNQNFIKGDYKVALEETFLKMDQLLMSVDGADLLKEFRLDTESTSFAGCTANVVLITKTEIYVANAGDSRAYLYTETGETVPLSTDHKPDNETERARIYAAGGYVSDGRVNDNLNLSRAIGDLEMKKNVKLPQAQQMISAFPDVVIKPFDKTCKYLIIGCDGIWETLTAQEILKIADNSLSKLPKPTLVSVCNELLDKLIAKDTTEGTGCDNMSLIILEFKR